MKDARPTTGFTIIEVMLFLAISGLMIAGLMIGISGSINRERYNEAVVSLHDYVQGQYNLVDNVVSNRSADFICSGGAVSATSPGAGDQIGTSNCSIVGRFITSQDGRKIVSQPVYATRDITELDDVDSEAELIDAMQLVGAPEELTEDSRQYTVSWQTNVYTDKGALTEGDFSLVMVRLPTNGMIRTFAVTSYDSSIQSVINASLGSDEPLALCVNPDGLISTPPLGVKILSVAPNANGAQRTAASDGVCS